MADPQTNESEVSEETQATAEASEAPAKSKKPVVFLGAALGIVALAFLAVRLAAPGTEKKPTFQGPFNAELFPDKFQVNLAGNGQKRYLQFVLNVIFEAYEENAILERAQDPLYEPYLQSTALAVCSSKTVDDIQGRANKEALMEELRAELEPVLFPVFIGEAKQALGVDPESGLRPGDSADEATFRGRYFDHVLVVDSTAKTIRLDDGEPVTYTGEETDLLVRAPDGSTLYLDVTGLDPDFSGEVHVGVKGRIRRVLPKYFLVQ